MAQPRLSLSLKALLRHLMALYSMYIRCALEVSFLVFRSTAYTGCASQLEYCVSGGKNTSYQLSGLRLTYDLCLEVF